MIKRNFIHFLKKSKIIILLLLLLIIAILFYNNKTLETMTINIYADQKGYKLNEVPSNDVKPYDKNKSTLKPEPINPNDYMEKADAKTASAKTTSAKTAKDAKDAKVAKDAKTASAKDAKIASAKELDNAIAKKSSSFINSFTGPISEKVEPVS